MELQVGWLALTGVCMTLSMTDLPCECMSLRSNFVQGSHMALKTPNPKIPNPKLPKPKLPNPKLPNPKLPNPKPLNPKP